MTTRLQAAGAAVPRKKARGGEVAVGRTKAAATIKDGREAKAFEEEVDDAGIDDDEVAGGGRRRPTTPTTTPEAANVDKDEATSGGRRRPLKKARCGEVADGCTKTAVTIKGGREAEVLEEEGDDAGIVDDEVASGGRCRPTTPTTTSDAANVDNKEAMNGGRRGPLQKTRGREAAVGRIKAAMTIKGGREADALV